MSVSRISGNAGAGVGFSSGLVRLFVAAVMGGLRRPQRRRCQMRSPGCRSVAGEVSRVRAKPGRADAADPARVVSGRRLHWPGCACGNCPAETRQQGTAPDIRRHKSRRKAHRAAGR